MDGGGTTTATRSAWRTPTGPTSVFSSVRHRALRIPGISGASMVTDGSAIAVGLEGKGIYTIIPDGNVSPPPRSPGAIILGAVTHGSQIAYSPYSGGRGVWVANADGSVRTLSPGERRPLEPRRSRRSGLISTGPSARKEPATRKGTKRCPPRRFDLIEASPSGRSFGSDAGSGTGRSARTPWSRRSP